MYKYKTLLGHLTTKKDKLKVNYTVRSIYIYLLHAGCTIRCCVSVQ